MRDAALYVSNRTLRKLRIAADLLSLSCADELGEKLLEDGLAAMPRLKDILTAQERALEEAKQQLLNEKLGGVS